MSLSAGCIILLWSALHISTIALYCVFSQAHTADNPDIPMMQNKAVLVYLTYQDHNKVLFAFVQEKSYLFTFLQPLP